MRSRLQYLFILLVTFGLMVPIALQAQPWEQITETADAPPAIPKIEKHPTNGYLIEIAQSESAGPYAQWGGKYESNVGDVYLKVNGAEVTGNWKGGVLFSGKIVEFRGTFQIEYHWATPHTGEAGQGIFAVNAHNPNMLIGSFWFTAGPQGTPFGKKYDWAITRANKK